VQYFSKNKKTIARVVCLLLLAAVFLSMSYIIKEANHDCIGAGCPVCAHIQMAERAIGELGTALVLIVHTSLSMAFLSIVLFQFTVNTVFSTPVSQNVRMNN
jgi:predicted transcriptional regulator